MAYRSTRLIFDSLTEKNSSSREIEIPLLGLDKEDIRFVKEIQTRQSKKIGDHSCIVKPAEPTPLMKICDYLNAKYGVIHPDSNLLLFWNILNTLAIYYNFIEIPLVLFLDDQVYYRQFNSVALIILNVIILIILFLDIFLVRPHLAFFNDYEIVIERYTIVMHYMSKQFIVDIIGFLSLLVYVVAQQNLIYLKILFFVKIYTLIVINQEIQSKLQLHVYWSALYKFLRTVFLIYFVTSFYACIYFAIDLHLYKQQGFFYENKLLWLTGSNTVGYINILQTFEYYQWYIYALYWAVQTSSSVGYGNMTPRNPYEVFFCNITMLTTVVIFVYFINTVIDIASQIAENQTIKQEKQKSFKEFIKDINLPDSVEEKINHYINSVVQNIEDQYSATIQSFLSEKLKIELKIICKEYFIEYMPVFRFLNKNSKFCIDVVELLEEKYYAEDSIVYKEGETEQFKLFFIKKGEINLSTIYHHEVKDAYELEYFGQREFFFGGKRSSTASCRQFSRLIILEKKNFLSKIKTEENIYEQYLEMINEAQMEQVNIKYFRIACQQCKQPHLSKSCENDKHLREELLKRKLENRNKQSELNKQKNERKQRNRRNILSQKLIDVSLSEVKVDIVTSWTCFSQQNNFSTQRTTK